MTISSLLDIDKLLSKLLDLNGTDLHLRIGVVPVYRIDGLLHFQKSLKMVSGEDIKKIIFDITSKAQREKLMRLNEMDLSYSVKGKARFRVNIFRTCGTMGIAFRKIPFEIPDFNVLNLPSSILKLSQKATGMILITGATGSGKSTTIASLVNYINKNYRKSILTLEDPIEYLHDDVKSSIMQREISSDSKTWENALKSMLKQDAEVVVIGEIREPEVMSLALAAANSGRLVISTLHTSSATQTIDRILHFFHPSQHRQVRAQLSSCIQGIVCQILCTKKSGTGRQAACEILLRNSATKNLISEGNLSMLFSTVESGVEQGMQSMRQHMLKLVKSKVITYEEALLRSFNQSLLKEMAESMNLR